MFGAGLRQWVSNRWAAARRGATVIAAFVRDRPVLRRVGQVALWLIPFAGGVVATEMFMRRTDPPSVRAQWSEAIGRFGYTAIYPMREDVQPGDVLMQIFWQCGDVEQVSARPTAVFLGHLPQSATRDMLERQLIARPSFPASGEGGTGRQPRTADGRTVFGEPGDAARLRLVSLPANEYATAFGASASLSRTFLNLGSQTELLLSLTEIEESGLPAMAAFAVMEEFFRSSVGFAVLRADHLGRVAQGLLLRTREMESRRCGNAKPKAELRVVVIGRVLYARAIEYTIASGAEAALAADPESDKGEPAQPPAGPGARTDRCGGATEAVAPAAAKESARYERRRQVTQRRCERYERPMAFAYEPLYQAEPCSLIAFAGGFESITKLLQAAGAAPDSYPSWVKALCPAAEPAATLERTRWSLWPAQAQTPGLQAPQQQNAPQQSGGTPRRRVPCELLGTCRGSGPPLPPPSGGDGTLRQRLLDGTNRAPAARIE